MKQLKYELWRQKEDKDNDICAWCFYLNMLRNGPKNWAIHLKDGAKKKKIKDHHMKRLLVLNYNL